MIPTLYPDLLLILPEIIILFTGSILLVNGVTTRSYKITHLLSIVGSFSALFAKLIIMYIYSYELDASYSSIFSGTLVSNKLESLFSIIILVSLIASLNLIKVYKNQITLYKSEFY